MEPGLEPELGSKLSERTRESKQNWDPDFLNNPNQIWDFWKIYINRQLIICFGLDQNWVGFLELEPESEPGF
jgi:hypothetical protein